MNFSLLSQRIAQLAEKKKKEKEFSEDMINESLVIFIYVDNVNILTGFESGKTVLVEGKLISTFYT